MFWFFDWTIVLMIPAVILAFWAQAKVSTNLNKYAKVATSRGMTGLQVAQQLLHEAGIRDVEIEKLPEHKVWADHYDPKHKKIRLSAHVHDSTSVSALAVAAHEVGHAIQHSESYGPLAVRSGFFPIARFGSGLAIPLVMVGLILGMLEFIGPNVATLLINIGIIAFTAVVAFQLVTLPVEFNASTRAMALLESGRFLNSEAEVRGAKKVLNAAAMTYVAAAAASVLTLIRLLIIANNRN